MTKELQLLCETTKVSTFKEDKDKVKPDRVLKIVTGPVADFKLNRNGRIYPRELWENVINSDYVKEMIENKSLFGEADHPEDRLEISMQNISHAINKVWIEEGLEEVWAEIHILDTPLGHMVANLLEYGTNIGISSRGAGSVGMDNVVDPYDYKFMTWDIVARPSVAAARPTIVESAIINNCIEDNKKINTYIKEEELKECILSDSFKKLNEMF